MKTDRASGRPIGPDRRCPAAILLAAAAAALSGCGGGDQAPSVVATSSTAAPRPSTSTTTLLPPTTSASTTTTATASTTVTTNVGAAIQPVTAADLGASWHDGCPVGPDQLRRITVTHVGFDGREHAGTLVVHTDWAEPLLGVFEQLRAAGFPIERIEPVDVYGADDDASMAVNNTSAFNCRPVTNGTSWSRHSYGTAIDINPRQNPYVLGEQVLPPEGRAHLDRTPGQGRILPGDAVVEAFAAIGWQWGGDWTSPVDYQHFDSG